MPMQTVAPIACSTGIEESANPANAHNVVELTTSSVHAVRQRSSGRSFARNTNIA